MKNNKQREKQHRIKGNQERINEKTEWEEIVK